MKYTANFATQNDIQKIIDIYSEWTKFKDILPDTLIEVDTYDELIKYFDGTNNTRKYIIATSDHGDAHGVCYIDLSFLGLNNIRLSDMIVIEKYRQSGIGSLLIDKVIDFAKTNSVHKVWLWTQEELKPALKLYKSKGFKYEGRQDKQFCNKDALLYGLVL